jgi:DNA-binding CsgD family transcriptional regulator/tetratricopeptide (TPR) repeat protein
VAARVSSPRFVGRHEERAALASALRSARAGVGAVALVAAEAGMGKSRLLAETGAAASRDGMAVAVGECLPLGDAELPYAPIVGAVRSLVRGPDPLVGSDREGPAALPPELAPGDVGADEPPGEGSQARLFEQLLALLAGAARAQPLVLVIEDLQWADRATRDFLAFLVRAVRREPIALVISYRSDELHRRHPLRPFVLELERSGRALRIELAPFTPGELREQVAAILDEVPPPQLVDRLFERSEGNPFYTEELLASSREPGEPLPASLRDSVLARVDARPAVVRDVLRIAAVAGAAADHARLATLTGLSEPELNRALRDAVESSLLTHDVSLPGYAFRHALVREAIYADLLPGERREAHLRLARSLTDQAAPGATHAAELAHHWYAAGELRASLAASLDAGVTAEGLYAFGEAGLHYERALEVWDRVDPAPGELPLDRPEVLRRAADAALSTGDTRRAIALVRELLGRIDERAAPVQAALAHERLGRYLWAAGHDAAALPAYRRAVELIPEDPPSEERALVLAAEGQALMCCYRTAESSLRCTAALAMARAVGAEAVEAHVLNTICGNLCGAGRFAEAVGAAGQARAIARRLRLPMEVNRSYMNGSDALDEAGRVEESIALAREGVESDRELGADRSWGDLLRGEIAGRLLQLGRWDEAARLLEEVLDRGPTGVTAQMAHRHLASLCAERGELDAAAAALDEVTRQLHGARGSMTLGPPAAARASVELWADRPGAALGAVTDCLERIGDRHHLFFAARLYELGVRACAELTALAPGDARTCAEQTAIARQLLERFDAQIARQTGVVAPLARASRAAAAAECSRIGHPGDAALWAEARREWAACGNPYQAAYASWRQAEAVLATGGERAQAEALVRTVHGVAGELGARPLRERVEALGRRARIDLAPRPAPDAHGRAVVQRLGLTPREQEVLALLAGGLTNRDIAGELFISGKTASVHVSRILAKLSVPNRAAAAAVAERLGLAA